MNELVLYLLQSGISLTLLYGVYWIFLRKDTFFLVNRTFLVASVMFSLLFPLLQLKWIFPAEVTSTYYVVLDAVTVNATKIETTFAKNLTAMQVLLVVYLTGIAIFTIRFIFQLMQLAFLVYKNGISKHEGLRIVFIDSNYSPFSFFNLIFINRKEINQQNIKEIITHEQVHIRQNHSADLILLEIMTIVQWFNPFVWFYRTSLKSVHEFLADQGVLLKGYNPVNYQNLLIGQYMGIQVNDLTNNFNHSLLKKRITMMTKSKSNYFAKLKVLLVTPVAFFLVVAFTVSPVVKTVAQVDKQTQKVEAKSQSPQDGDQNELFTVVENMPKFPGGEEARAKFFAENIKYPEAARKAGVQGTCYVTFVIEADGSTSNVKVLRGIGGGCDEEAVRVIQSMPKWEPGTQRGKAVRVQFNMPVKFSLGEGDKKVIEGYEIKPGTLPPPPPPPSQQPDKK
jgi:TonB family protein